MMNRQAVFAFTALALLICSILYLSLSPVSTCISIPSAVRSRPYLPHIPELDGIRGLAALAVFCHHLLFTSIPFPERGGPVLLCVWRVSRAGAYGVDLFFVLSGFLITSIILIERDQPHFYWNFYWKRALRIFPLYAVSLACLAALLPASRPYVMFSALFVANFAPAFHVVADGPFWTLAIEEQFYTVWPQFAKRLTVERLRQLAFVIVAAGLLLRLGAASLGHHNFRYTFFHCDGLALGAILACQSMVPSTGRRRGRSEVLQAAAAFVLLLLTFAFPLAGRWLPFVEALQVLAVSLTGYSLVAMTVRYSGSPALGVLRTPFLRFFGFISYCLYMSHLYLMRFYDWHFGPPEPTAAMHLVARFLAVLALTVIVCLLSRYTVELPAMKLRRYMLRPR